MKIAMKNMWLSGHKALQIYVKKVVEEVKVLAYAGVGVYFLGTWG